MSERIDRSLLRVGDVDREATIARLHEATEQGRIDIDEFTTRVDAVYVARTFGELDVVTRDLPAGRAEPVRHEIPPMTVDPSMSSFGRTGVWTAPSRFVLRPRMSSVNLDFRRAIVEAPVVDIAIEASTSSIVIAVPPDAFVVDDITVSMSSSRNRAPRLPRTTGVEFRVHGDLSMSSLSIRRARRNWWRR